MTGMALEIRNELVVGSTRRVASKQVWAQYVRRRWPRDCVAHVQREWSLSAAQARGLVFGHASQPTIDAILSHKRGGPLLEITVSALAWGQDVDAFMLAAVEELQRRSAHARTELEAEERRSFAVAGRVRSLGLVPRSLLGGTGSEDIRDRPDGRRGSRRGRAGAAD